MLTTEQMNELGDYLLRTAHRQPYQCDPNTGRLSPYYAKLHAREWLQDYSAGKKHGPYKQGAK